MLGGTRVIPTDGRPHVSSSIRQWIGHSTGRWDGDTLVIETSNFTDKVLYRGAAENLQLVERIKRVGPDELDTASPSPTRRLLPAPGRWPFRT